MVFSSYFLRILFVFCGGIPRGAAAAHPNPCMALTALVGRLFKEIRAQQFNSDRTPAWR